MCSRIFAKRNWLPSRPRNRVLRRGTCYNSVQYYRRILRAKINADSWKCSVSSRNCVAVESPNRLLDAAGEIQAFCEQNHWPFCFIGGIAVLHWGEARVTRGADLTIFTGVGDEIQYVDRLLGKFAPRIDDGRDFALRHRVILLRASNGIPLDLSLGALPFEEKAVAGAKLHEFAPGVKLRLCSPAALVVFKVFAGRPQDWLDVEGIVVKSGKLVDWSEVRRDLGELLDLKGDTESLSRLETILGSAPHR